MTVLTTRHKRHFYYRRRPISISHGQGNSYFFFFNLRYNRRVRYTPWGLIDKLARRRAAHENQYKYRRVYADHYIQAHAARAGR